MACLSGSVLSTVLAAGTRVFRLTFLVAGRVRMLLHEWLDCSCGCSDGWNNHVAYTEQLRLRVQIWQRQDMDAFGAGVPDAPWMATAAADAGRARAARGRARVVGDRRAQSSAEASRRR
jgi:hypothetical protein